MNVIDLDNQYQYREENMKIEDKNKFKLLLQYLHWLCKKNKFIYRENDNLLYEFLINYHILGENGYKDDINLYMKTLGFKKNSFIYELLYYRFSYEGLLNLIKSNNGNYLLDIENKHYEFDNVFDYFDDLEIKNIFNKKLEKECFDRTLDLVYCIKDSSAVVSYLPNIFVGGHYHAYIKCSDGTLIDPSSSMVMLNDNAKELLNGNVVFSMDRDMLELALDKLREVEGIDEYDRPKLLKLALYMECIEIEKENLAGISKKSR